MDYRDRAAVCARCGAEMREGRCPSCGAPASRVARSAIAGWSLTIGALTALAWLLLRR